jgi:hypothetical protein
MTTDNFCLYLQNRLIQISQTWGQRYSDTSPLVFPDPSVCVWSSVSLSSPSCLSTLYVCLSYIFASLSLSLLSWWPGGKCFNNLFRLLCRSCPEEVPTTSLPTCSTWPADWSQSYKTSCAVIYSGIILTFDPHTIEWKVFHGEDNPESSFQLQTWEWTCNCACHAMHSLKLNDLTFRTWPNQLWVYLLFARAPRPLWYTPASRSKLRLD